mgnify:CR=1 FL=1
MQTDYYIQVLLIISIDDFKNIKTEETKMPFTHKRRPLELIFHQEFNAVEQAIYFEKKLKKWSAKKKLALANGNYEILQILAECRNMTHFKFRPTAIEVSTALDQT